MTQLLSSEYFTPVLEGPVVSNGGNSQGSLWADFDNDGNIDLFVPNGYYTNNFLYHNNGDGTFTDISETVITANEAWSRGGSWADFNNDGFIDLFVANTGTSFDAFYLNRQGYNFIDISYLLNELEPGNSHSGSWGDFDNDGDLDLFISSNTGDNLLYQNSGTNGNWLKIKCIGHLSNTAAIGTKIRIKCSINDNEIWQLREISSQTGRSAQDGFIAHFGLDYSELADSVIIEWPSGIK